MIILTADDYAMTAGVSRGIVELAQARRLSATSVMTTMAGWPAVAGAIRAERGHLAIGLHLNLTLGAPLGPMPLLAPAGRLPELQRLIGRALTRRLDAAEIAAEIGRQIDRFTEVLGFPPDHVDGHQHVHVLPGVRGALLAELARRFEPASVLIRVPSASPLGVAMSESKALLVGTLAFGFANATRARGFPTNDSFAGFSAFDTNQPFAPELARALESGRGSRRHIVMCHPGYPDAELAALDPVVERRRQELDAMTADASLPARIWHPARATDGRAFDWAKVAA